MNKNVTPLYYLRMANILAEASTCRANVGCMIVKNNVIVGIGYVGSVHGDAHCNEHGHILCKAEHRPDGDTCVRTIHAEMNAVLKCHERGDAKSGWMYAYCTHQPCLDCLKVLLQIGVRHIYYAFPYGDKRRDAYLVGLHQDNFYNQPKESRLTMEKVEL